MANYSTEAQIEFRIGFAIDATSRPTSTELAGMMNTATSIINAEAMASSNMTDTYGVLREIEINMVVKMINNVFALAEPDVYPYVEIELTPEEKRLIHMAHRRWASLHWEIGG